MIELKNVSKSFETSKGPLEVIKNISLQINKKEIFGIIGESGAGKSTLLRFINALEKPTSGTIKVNDVDVQKLNKHQLRHFKKNIGMIFQQFNLLGNKTVAENIMLPLQMYPYDDALDIDQVLEFVGLTDKKDSYPSELSGGQKQRVGIARGLITRPKILLCDEPTSALDETTKREIVALLEQATKTFDVTVLVVTHELDVVKQLCDRVAILEEGHLVEVIELIDTKEKLKTNVSYSELAREVLSSV